MATGFTGSLDLYLIVDSDGEHDGHQYVLHATKDGQPADATFEYTNFLGYGDLVWQWPLYNAGKYSAGDYYPGLPNMPWDDASWPRDLLAAGNPDGWLKSGGDFYLDLTLLPSSLVKFRVVPTAPLAAGIYTFTVEGKGIITNGAPDTLTLTGDAFTLTVTP